MGEPPPTISVCMIVKNEEDLLPQALASVKGFADELIVVDTGSTDGTVAIAEAAKAKVYHHPWEHDFARHRNQSLDYAGGDWLFVLDADETLTEQGAAALKQAALDPAIDVISIPVVSPAAGGERESSHNSVRMFRRRTGIRYAGAVHNEVDHRGRATFVPARLIHHGYNLSRARMRAKFERTAGLLRREMERDPADPKWPHYLAVSLHTENFFAEARTEARRSLDLCAGEPAALSRWLPNYYVIASAELALGDLAQAERACREALAVNSDYLDAWAVLTSVAFKRDDLALLDEAAGRFRMLVEAYRQDPRRFGHTPLHTLAQLPQV
ncbi:MAG: glycosyltransferase family 2 protein, partial [Myxococcales bacterium]